MVAYNGANRISPIRAVRGPLGAGGLTRNVIAGDVSPDPIPDSLVAFVIVSGIHNPSGPTRPEFRNGPKKHLCANCKSHNLGWPIPSITRTPAAVYELTPA